LLPAQSDISLNSANPEMTTIEIVSLLRRVNWAERVVVVSRCECTSCTQPESAFLAFVTEVIVIFFAISGTEMIARHIPSPSDLLGSLTIELTTNGTFHVFKLIYLVLCCDNSYFLAIFNILLIVYCVYKPLSILPIAELISKR
jgi:hypothetical protein